MLIIALFAWGARSTLGAVRVRSLQIGNIVAEDFTYPPFVTSPAGEPKVLMYHLIVRTAVRA
jgi:hypothetical protein